MTKETNPTHSRYGHIIAMTPNMIRFRVWNNRRTQSAEVEVSSHTDAKGKRARAVPRTESEIRRRAVELGQEYLGERMVILERLSEPD